MKIGFIGAGNMATAMVCGLINNKVCLPKNIICASGSRQSAAALSEKMGIHLAESRKQVISDSDLTVLAFKPQHLESITPEESEAANSKLIISVLAGRTLESLSNTFPSAANTIRVMPNTPSKIGMGVSTYCFAQDPSKEHRALILKLLGALGTAHPVEEDQLHIATAVNGCGPAVFFQFIDFIAQAAEKRGLAREQATRLAIETGIGSLELMLQSKSTPEQLVTEVVSPNGVTHALLESLNAQSWSHVLDTAMDDAVKRSIELSKS